MLQNLKVSILALRAALGVVFLLLANWHMTSSAQNFFDYNLNDEILERLERHYIIDLGLSELSAEKRKTLLDLPTEDLLEVLKVDDGTAYITPERLETFSDENTNEIEPPIFKIEGTVAILKYSEFNQLTTQETLDFFARPDTASIDLKGVIIDLRNNSGGLFNEITNLADLFLEDVLIFSIEARDERDTERLYAETNDIIQGKPLIILTDDTTASGAAMLARAMQTNGRAKVYGRPSADIAFIQGVFPLGYGRKGALKVSTHKIVFSDGQIGSNSTVVPDVYVTEDILKKAIEAIQSGGVQ